jgi:hypothetical protein
MAVTIESYRLHAWQQIPIVQLRADFPATGAQLTNAVQKGERAFLEQKGGLLVVIA